jgi:fibronectin-binding autotransporter adhesin
MNTNVFEPVPVNKHLTSMKTCLAKTPLSPLRALLILSAALGVGLAPQLARATSASWLASPTDGNWVATGSENNWSTGTATWPGGTSTGSGDTATFDVNSSVTDIIVNNGGNCNIKNVTFDTADCSAYTIDVTGGTFRLTSGGTLQITAAVTQPQVFTGGQIRLHTSAGTTLLNDSTTPAATFTFTGGFKANNSSGSLTQSPINLQGANTGSNVISGPIQDYHHPNDSGYAPCSVNKSGAGTWYLTANNTYQGPTTVSGGLLALTGNGSIAESASITITGGTLEWDNAFSTTNMAVGPGALIIGTSANLTTLTLADTAALTLPAGASAPTVVDTLTVGGTTTLNISSVPGFTSYSAAQFPVISYTSQSGLGDTSFVLGTLPSTYQGYISNNTANSSIDVVITNGPALPNLITWNGNVSGDWDTSTLNWLLAGNATNYAQGVYSTFPGDFVTFDDTATGQTNINLTTTITPGSLTVSNTAGTATANYAFIGGGGISGTTGLAKEGSGDLTIANSGVNDFSGNIVLDAGSLTVDQTADVTLANSISGSAGALIKDNTNTLSLSGANSYGGATTIAAGTLMTFNSSSLGATPGGNVTIADDATLDIGGDTSPNDVNFGAKQFYVAGVGVSSNGVIVNSGGVNQQNAFENITLTADATFGGPYRWDMRGGSPGPNLDLGGFTLTKTDTNQISLVSVAVTAGDVVINGGILSFETTSSFTGAGTITVNSGGALGQYRPAIGSMTRPITLNGGAIQNLATSGTVGTNDAPITLTANSTLAASSAASYTLVLNGVISESGGSFGLTKTGAGMFTLSAANTFSGETTIAQGTLALSGSGSIGNSANIGIASGATLDASGRSDGTLALASGQTLKGNGTVVGTMAVGSGATVAPGASVGQLTDTGSVSLQGGGSYAVEVQNAASGAGVGNDNLAVSGDIGVLATSGNKFTIKLVSLDGSGAAGAVTNFDNTTNYTWTIATGTVTNFDASVFTVDTNGFANALGGGQFFVNSTGNSLVLLFKTAASVGGVGGSISNPTVDGSGHPTFSGHGIPSYIYGVESATSVSGPWSEAGTVTADANGSWSFTDASQTDPGTIFYRLYYPDNPGNPPQ